MNDILEAIASSPVGVYMAESPYGFPTVETVHVMAITLVFGVISIVDLRLMGVASLTYPISKLSKTLVPLTWIAFAIAAITGGLLFTSQPFTYYENFAFRMKMLLLVGAAVNMGVFHLLTMRGISLWDVSARIPTGVRIAGFISLLIWILVVGFGRWIGFTMSPF